MERNTVKEFTPEQIAHYTETRIDDPVKAENVALKGKAQAGYTAEVREAIHIVKLFQAGFITYRQLEKLGDGHQGFSGSVDDGEERLASSYPGTLRKAKKGECEEVILAKERIAEIEQQVADEVMDWASVLYDHPISDSYREAHPELKFKRYQGETANEPFELWELSERVEKSLERIKKLEEELKLIDTSRIWDEKKAVDGWTMRRLAEDSQEDQERLKGLIENPGTTVDEQKKFYAELFEAKIINPRLEYIADIFNTLEDIKSGKASLEYEASNPAAA